MEITKDNDVIDVEPDELCGVVACEAESNLYRFASICTEVHHLFHPLVFVPIKNRLTGTLFHAKELIGLVDFRPDLFPGL